MKDHKDRTVKYPKDRAVKNLKDENSVKDRDPVENLKDEG